MVKVYNIFCLMLLVSVAPLLADDSRDVDTVLDKMDPLLDYKIGGTSSLSRRRLTPTVDVNYPEFGWNVGASCSGWDAGISVSGLMNDAESKFQRLQKDVVSSITGFITQYPMLLIQRQDPGLYEMLNNSILNGEDIFDISAASCRDMSKRYMEGSNGLGDVVETSGWLEFSSNASEGKENKDLISEIENADENKGSTGVVAMCGEKCGGDGLPMCKPVIDTIIEGFKKMSDEEYNCEANHDNPSKKPLNGSNSSFNLGNNSNASSTIGSDPVINWVYQIWDKPEDAARWIMDVVGDTQYATCQDCTKLIEIPGYGVYSFIADEATEIRDALSLIVEGDNVPSLVQLRDISSNDVLINESVIYALRDEVAQRHLFITRIAQDVALLRTVDMLLAARRIMIAGKGDANFTSVPKNLEIVDSKINMLAEEVGLIKEELELKRIARGDAVATLLGRFESRLNLRQDSSTDGEIQRRAVEGLQKVTGRGQ